MHVPNHDAAAVLTTLRAINFLQPSYVVVLGDFADFASLSGHDRDRPTRESLQQEAVAVNTMLTAIETASPEAKRIYIQGNHEHRLDRYLMRTAEQVFPFVRFQDIINLTQWTYVPYRSSYKLGKLYLTHDTGRAGINAHRYARDSHMGNTIIGHTHRMAYEVKGTFQGQPHLAAMFGWLGDAKKAAEYAHEANSSDWVHGFGIGYMEQDGVVHVTPVPIINGKALVEGRLIS